ncbi:MAG TPA: transglycosylase SLT domain-containing protein, partial [Methylomicrobium sp.]|nr:transglycosylase SLT domain-containing protein [Methylomicrobium sp.]
MQINSNRSVKLLSLSLSLIAAGCSQSSKNSLNVYDRPPQVSADDTSFFDRFSYRNKIKPGNGRYETVWDRLLSLYALPEINNERIDREINWYLQHPQSLVALQQRAEPYMHHILDEVEAKRIPGELALLPVVESSFVPDAYSKSDASGLWQFIPSTGKEFGLKQNTWYDGRRDVYESTKAATAYLKQLSDTFNGDWLLALASYNYGKGNVRKCIERNEDMNLPTDFWSLSLPEETYNYVPKLLAVAKIFANADQYHIPLRHIPNQPYFEVVDIKAPLDLNKAAQMANTPLRDFLKLNPGFNRWCTAPDGPHRLLIPVKNAPLFKKNLAEIPFDERINFSKLIAEQQEQIIAEANVNKPQPVASKKPSLLSSTASLAEKLATYKVKRGETLASIARNNHTTVQNLRSINHLPRTMVNYGAVLKVPTSEKPNARSLDLVTSSQSSTSYYTVKKGDTFSNIGRRYSVSPQELA